jgi:glutamate-1-semialdehyde 2,1-aminomutase
VTAEQLKIHKFNDLENVKTLIEANKNEIGAIIVEPVAGTWLFRQIKVLEGLRQLVLTMVYCHFDEVDRVSIGTRWSSRTIEC